MNAKNLNRTIWDGWEADPRKCAGRNCPQSHEGYTTILGDGSSIRLETSCNDTDGFTTVNHGRRLNGGQEQNPQQCEGCHLMHHRFMANRTDGTSVELAEPCEAA